MAKISLEDKLAIQELMVRYAYAIDVDCTEQEFLDLFTEDAVMESPLSGLHEGVEGVKKFRQRFAHRRGKLQIRHVITNFLVDGEGEHATLKAYFLEYKTELARPAGERRTEFFFGGSYDCVMRKIGGRWRIQRRTVFIDDRS